MTDEEKKVKGYLKDICPICNDREACLQDGCNCYIEQAYLDGLAEGRKEKWHDLRKNPNDLPKDEEDLKEYLVAYKNFNNPNEIVVGCFTWDSVRFIEYYDYSEIPYFENKNVLFAWCELPKFEE